MKVTKLLAAVIGICVSWSANARVVFLPTTSGTATDNLGDGSFETIQADTIMAETRNIGLVFKKRGIFEFDLTVLPDSTVITQASLIVQTLSASLDRPTLEFYGYPGNGISELSDVDVVVKTLIGRTDLDPVTTVSYDVTTFVTSTLGSGNVFPGFIMKLEDETLPTTAPRDRFQRVGVSLGVEVGVIPLPTSAWLASSGLAVLGFVAWRKKNSQQRRMILPAQTLP